MSDRVALSFDTGIARLSLVRADAGNAIDPAMVRALAEAVESVEGASDVGALLIRHEGRAFSVGGDLGYLGPRAERLPEELEPMVGLYHETLARLARLPLAIVCAARGAVAGGALGLMWVADVTIVSQDAKLATGFLELGLSGDGGSTWWLPRLVGLGRARQLMLDREPIDGTLAAKWGLITKALPADEVDAEAERAARTLAARPSAAYAEIRALLVESFGRSLEAGLQAEQDAMQRSAATDVARERVAAFQHEF
jgi:enoyl-CoA hydratase/carnithine racemase